VKQKALYGMLGWSAVDQFFRLGFQFLVMIVLARLLTPTDFGLYAMLSIFVGLANTFANAGLADALIQRKVTTHQEESSLFFFTIALALVVALILSVMSHWIAVFYKQPLLESIAYVMGFCVFIGSFTSVQTALFSKAYDFKTTALIGAVVSLFSGAVAISAAWAGWGVWSLVTQTLVATILSTLIFWFKHPWRPKLFFNLACIRPYLSFGGYLLISRLINVVSVNLYTLIIGKFYSAQEVGIFNRASNFQNLFINSISGIVAKVAFPVFAAAAEDHDRLERGLNKALLGTVFLSVPIAVILVMLADPIIWVLFGDQWIKSIPILQILGLEALIWPLHLLNVNLLMSTGRGDLMFRGVLVKFAVTLIMLLIAAPYGMLLMALAFVGSSYINLFVNIYYTKRILDYGLSKQLKAVMPCIISSMPMIVLIYATVSFLALNHLLLLIIGSLVGSSAYLISGYKLRIFTRDQMVKFSPIKFR
jgi:teichuronic acid exporter